jgi:hypothetical protein
MQLSLRNCRHRHRTSEKGDYNKQKQKKQVMTKPKFCRPGQESHDARDMHMDPQ